MYFSVLLVLIKIVLCKNFKIDKTETADTQTHETTDLSSTTRPHHEAQIQHTRLRRALNFKDRNKCRTSSQCTGNHTFFADTNFYYNCYCDNACYETFQDCCPDFVKTCGEQKKTNTTNSQPLWKCLAVANWGIYVAFYGPVALFGPSGIWMIANCSRNWALDETRTRCENAPDKFSFPVEDYLPVVGKNGFTYRNKHCAECNGETSYQSWYIEAIGLVTPPGEYNFDDKLRFLLTNGGEIIRVGH